MLAGEPVVGQMQIDPCRLDRAVPGLGLHGLQRHACFTQPGQAGMPQLVTRAALQTGPVSGAVEDLIDPLVRQRMSAAGPFNTTNNRSVADGLGRSSGR